MKSLLSTSTHLALFALLTGVAFAQSVDHARARMVSEFGNISADTEMSHLDLLARALTETPNARGYVIGYSRKHFPPGLFLRRLYGYQDYLVNTRGVEPGRVVIVKGGEREKITAELWLIPEGASAPGTNPEYTFSLTGPLRFDTAYPDCPSESSIYLEELDDYLRFYAEALREHPDARSRVVVYPGRRSGLGVAAKMARDTKNLLVRRYHISNGRIVARARNRRRECSEIELWIVPAGTASAGATHNSRMCPTFDQRSSYPSGRRRAGGPGFQAARLLRDSC